MAISGKATHARYEKMLDEMVDKFLCWQLPQDFGPDCYVSFDRSQAENKGWPVGTNLLTAAQARELFKHCVPPICFGLDDCSSQTLSTCRFADNCGK